MTKKFITVRVPSNDEAIILPRIGMAGLVRMVTRRHPKPDPPMQEVRMGETVQLMPNPTHESYETVLKLWQDKVSEEVNDNVWKIIAQAQFMNEERKKEVDSLREAIGEDGIPSDDRLAWFLHFGMPSTEYEMKKLMESCVTQKNKFNEDEDTDDDVSLGEPVPSLVQEEIEIFPAQV